MQIMQSFTVNVNEEQILSLSEDDDVGSGSEYGYKLYGPKPHTPITPLTPSLHKLDLDFVMPYDAACDDAKEQSPDPLLSPSAPPEPDLVDHSDDEKQIDDEHAIPREKEEKPATALSAKHYDDDDDHGDEEEEDEVFVFNQNSSLTLDSDIEIAKFLNQTGYKRVCKLNCTEQGSVWRARSPDTQSVVIKMASKLYYTNKASPVPTESILNEIKLIQAINEEQKKSDSLVVRRSIIQVLDTIDTEKHHMMVVEDGGTDLLCFVQKCHQQIARGLMAVSEWQKTLRLISKRLIEVIHWLHSEAAICHLDLSLENVMISNVNWISYPDQYKEWKKRLAPDFQLKLIDFGAAQQFGGGDASFDCLSVFGKPTYCAPEIFALQNKRSENAFDARKADIWSFGVCLFTMAIGGFPWSKPDERSDKRFETIVVERDLEFVLSKFKKSHFMHESLKDLIQKIFVMDEAERISTVDILKHEWF